MFGLLCFILLTLTFGAYIISTKMVENENAEFFYKGMSVAFLVSLFLVGIAWIISVIK